MSVDFELLGTIGAVREAVRTLKTEGLEVADEGTVSLSGVALGHLSSSGKKKCVLSGRGRAALFLAAIAAAVSRVAGLQTFDPQTGEPLGPAPSLAEARAELARELAADREPTVPTPRAPTPSEEGTALLKLLVGRGMIEADPDSGPLADVLGAALRAKTGSAGIIELLVGHCDVTEVFASDDELTELLEAW